MSEKSNLSEEYLTEGDLMPETEVKSRNWFKEFILGPYWVVPVIILVAVSAFSLGKVQSIKRDREPVKIIEDRNSEKLVESSGEKIQEKPQEKQNTQAASVIQSQDSGQVVGSKNSNKYHYPWCSGAKRISKENLVTFDSIEEARAQGYLPASNCQGLK
jgi:flagellar motor protein MotB